MFVLLLADQAREWSYVAGSYGIVIGVLVAYCLWVIVRGRRAGRQLPPEDRRWM